MKFRICSVIGVCLLLLSGLIACSSRTGSATPEPTASSSAALTDASTQSSPLATVERVQETNGSPTVSAVPSNLSDLADQSVVGFLMLQDGVSKKPAVNVILYLAETVADSQGQESVVAMDRINSPKATTDDQGQFVFSNVPAGNYGLVLDQISNAYLLFEPETTEAILVSVTEGQAVDLGELVFDDLPIIGQ